MVYLYAGLGVVMLSGIMAIFEMGLALTGQTLLPVPTDPYFLEPKDPSNTSMQDLDIKFLERFSDATAFSALVENKGGLCAALDEIDGPGWLSISDADARWSGGCQRSKLVEGATHRVIISKSPHQLFSCALDGEKTQCIFELE